MKIEEKAQAYDEALKKAKDYYEKGYMMINAVLVNIFPELKESEDERMRKEAISIIKQYNIICERECDKCYTADRVIAWLEKQAEQKPAWSEDDEKMREKLLFLMEEENSIDSWDGCYQWLKSLNKKK